MSIYYKCNTDILRYLILNWLSSNELVKLDSAICNKFDRQILNDIYHENNFIFNNMNGHLKEEDWFITKQIKFSRLYLTGNITKINGKYALNKKYKKCTFIRNNITNIKCIRIDVDHIKMRVPSKLIKKCNNLDVLICRRIDLYSGGFISKKTLHKLMYNNQNLLFISLNNCCFFNNVIHKIAINCLQLRILLLGTFLDCNIIYPESFVKLMTNCKFLTTFSVGMSKNFFETNKIINKYTDNYTNYLTNNCDDNYLTTLNISNLFIDINDKRVINSLNRCKIKNLLLHTYGSFRISHLGITYYSISSINFEILISKCDLLVSLELYLHIDNRITEDDLIKIIDKCIVLESLTIICNYFNDIGKCLFIKILKKCKSLKNINYRSKYQNTISIIDAVYKIAYNCNSLESLYLSFNNDNLTFNIFKIIFEKCKLLKNYKINLGDTKNYLTPSTIKNYPQLASLINSTQKLNI